MTIQELYDWAKEHEVENYDLVIRDCDGSLTYYIEPVITTHTYNNGERYCEVEL